MIARHRIGTQEEWQAERDAALKEEKEVTRRSDELAAKRRRLPRVPVENDYRFETEHGTYATTARGLEPAMVYYALLDRSPKGRDESEARPLWVRRHDEYETN